MAQSPANTETASSSLQFDAQDGLFGGSGESITWGTFLGIGGERPVTADVSLGGPLSVWLPFKGDTEILRLELQGEIATRMGLDINLEINPGQTRVSMPYDISFKYPDAQTLAANPYFRLEGVGAYQDNASAGFETDWPYFVFTIDAIFELAVLMNLVAGVLGDNETYKLLDFDLGVDIPIVDLDTRPDQDPVLFGLEFGENAALDFGLSGPDAYIENPTSFQASLSGSDIKITADEAEKEQQEKDPSGETKDDTDEKVTAENDKKQGSLLDEIDVSAGDLAMLTLNLPDIQLADRGEGDTLGLNETVTYTDGTREGDFDGTHDDVDPRGFIQDLALLELDLDDIAVEAIKRAFTGGVGVPNTPGLEGTVSLDLDGGAFAAGASFGYNLIDADLEFSLPINQTVDVTPQQLKTSLSFYRADADGEVIENADGTQEATWLEARLPRFSVYFNETNTFWNAAVAQGLRDAMQTNARAAEDIGRFVDFQNGRIPGAFTGQTGSISGGVVMREKGSSNWVQLSTNPEETEYLARTRPDPGGDPQLSDLKPRNDAEFRYVIYDNDTVVTGDVVDLSTVVGDFALDFGDLVGPDGIFEARLDVVTTPISSTGLIDGVPSIDLFFPTLANESIWTEVTHRAAADVSNDTSLDFNIDFVLTALELQLGAYVRAFGARFGLDFEFGPLWEKSFPLFAAELTKLYDDTFTVEEDSFSVNGGDAQEAWGFAIGAGGQPTVFVTEGTAGDDIFDAVAALSLGSVDGKDGTDTLSFVRWGDAEGPVIVDLAEGRVKAQEEGTELVFKAFDQAEGTIRGQFGTSWEFAVGTMDAIVAFEITRYGGGTTADELSLTVQAQPAAGGFAFRLGDYLNLSEGETAYVWVRIRQGLTELFVSRDPSERGDRVDAVGWTFSQPGAALAIYMNNASPDGSSEGRSYKIRDFSMTDSTTSQVVTFDDMLAEGSGAEDQYRTWNVRFGEASAFDVTNVENVAGSRFSDHVSGDFYANLLEGGEGDDTLDGRGGSDRLIGSIGNDVLITGGAGVGERDTAEGGEGDDRIVASYGAALLDGGEDAPVGTSGLTPADLDIVDYRGAPGGITLNLQTGDTSGPWVGQHELVNIEGIAGTAFADILIGDAGRSYFEAGEGNDLLIGDHIPDGLSQDARDALKGGNDRLYGQGGNDTLIGGPGADMLDGGDGIDTVDYSASPSSVFVDLADGEIIDGTKYAPLLQGTGSEDIDFWRIDGRAWRGWAQGDKFRDVENVIGTQYEDILFGDAAANVIGGLSGDDRLSGRGGQDTLRGHGGNDIFWTASSGLAIGITYNPEDPALSDRKHWDYSVRNSAMLDPSSIGGDIDVVEGGQGDDLQILGWNGAIELVQDNVLHEVYEDGTSADIAYRVAYSVSFGNGATRLLGDLGTLRAGVEIAAGNVPNYNVTVTALSREGGAFEEVTDFGWDPAEFFDALYYGDNGGFPTITGVAGSYFLHTTNGLTIEDAVLVPIAQISSIEGFIGTTAEDVLLGGTGGDSLYGAGGSDIVFGDGGDDTLSFGAGQAPEALFSFPGRGIANITPFSAAAVEEGAAGDLSTNDQQAYDEGESDKGGTYTWSRNNPRPPDFYPDYTYAPMSHAPYAALINAYLAGPRGRDGLEQLRADLAATPNPDTKGGTISAHFTGFAMVDGGGGSGDTLDLRFDRGIGFLPDDGAVAARVFLNTYYAQAGGNRALVFGFENVVGTGLDDYLVGSDADNIIEGSGGADTMQGGGGIDTVSYANAKGGVEAVLLAANGNVVMLGNGSGDYFSGFEILRGSEYADRIGITTVGSGSGPSLSENAIQLFDAGKGDDKIFASGRGATYDGGLGDDTFFVPSGAETTGTGNIVLRGGAGTDTLVLDDAELLSLARTTNGWTAQIEGGVTVVLENVEFIDTGDVTLSLVNTDPTRVPRQAMTWDEDPWSTVAVFDGADASRLTSRSGVVSALPDTGVFQVRSGGAGALVDVRLGDVLTAAELETLVFVPGAGFGVRIGNGSGLRSNAKLSLEIDLGNGLTQPRTITVNPGDLDGVNLGLDTPEDTARAPVSYDVGALVDAAGFAGDIVHLSRLGRPDQARIDSHVADEVAAVNAAYQVLIIAEYDTYSQQQNAQEAELELGVAQREEAIAQAMYDADPSELHRVTLVQKQAVTAQRIDAKATADYELEQAESREADARAEFASAEAAEDAARDVAQRMFGDTITDALSETRFGDDQVYEITQISHGATLWLTDITPADAAPGTDRAWTNLRELAEGDVVTRAQLTRLAFESDDGFITSEDAVSFRALETLQAQVTAVPDQGVVFSPVIALNLSLDDVDPNTGALELTSQPADGLLFYRDESGARVEVTAGDVLSVEQIAGLHFEADTARTASLATEAERLADEIRQNGPTDDTGVAGEGVAPLPSDPTLLELTFRDVAEDAVFDGVTIDLEAVGETSVVPLGDDGGDTVFSLRQTYQTISGTIGRIQDAKVTMGVAENGGWVQWAIEDGGNGHFYAFQRLVETRREDFQDIAFQIIPGIGNYPRPVTREAVPLANGKGTIETYLDGWNADARGSDGALVNTAAGNAPIMLASVGSAAENDFIYSVFADENAIRGASGPRLGAELQGGNWVWDDGTPWDVTVWREGEPNNSGGSETTVHYAMIEVDAEQGLFLPQWNDVPFGFDAPGFIIEAPTLATGQADLLKGSLQDDFMRGGGGDDSLSGREGNDILRGDSGDDTLNGQAGDDTLTGGSGRDVFVMARNAGTDVVTDFVVGADRIDVSALNLTTLSEIRVDQLDGNLRLHAKGSTIVLEGLGVGTDAHVFTALDFTGYTVRLSALMPSPDDLALSVGDLLDLDEIDGLRYRAVDDANGAMGRFEYRVLDPWASDLADALMPDGRNGSTDGRVTIDLEAINDAPRGGDRAYLVSAGGVLIANDPRLALGGFDPEGDPITVSLVKGPRHGDLTLNADGTFVYRPDAGFVGDPATAADDTFTYALSDGQASSVYTVSLDIQDTSQIRYAPASAGYNENGFRENGGLTSDDVLGGHFGADHISSTWGNDWILAYGGPDSIEAGDGDDSVEAGSGYDTVHAGRGRDTVDGGDGRDLVYLEEGDDLFLDNEQGDENGRDTVFGGDGHDTIQGGNGDDAFFGERGNDRIFARLGNDRVFGGEGLDTLYGGDGDDTHYGGGGNDSLFGGAGNDRLYGELGADIVFGGEGDDQIGGGDAYDTIEAGIGNDTVWGGNGRDLIRLQGGNDVFWDEEQTGENAHDTVFGGTGNDTLNGDGGDDVLYGEAGDDVIHGGIGADKIAGGDAYDTIEGGAGNDTVWGGNGRDLIFLQDGHDVFWDEDQTGEHSHDTVFGGTGDDALNGDGGNDQLWGEEGEDVIFGGDGDDKIGGGAAYDTIDAGAGDDTVWGGDGRDLIRLQAGDDVFWDNAQTGVHADDTVFGGEGNDVLNGGGGNDALWGETGDDLIYGGAGQDLIGGGDSYDTIEAGAGHDTVWGGNGRDVVALQDGDDRFWDETQTGIHAHDTVFGGNGNDTIVARGGNDSLTGGTGADVFVFDVTEIGNDTVADYDKGIDSLHIDADLWAGAFDQARLDALSDTSSGSLVLEFGGGNTVTLTGVADATGLLDDILLV